MRELQLVFVEDWAYATGQPPLRLTHPAPQLGEIAAQVLNLPVWAGSTGPVSAYWPMRSEAIVSRISVRVKPGAIAPVRMP